MKEKVKGLFFVAVLLGDCVGLLFFIIARAFDLWSELQVFPKIVLGYGGICLVITIVFLVVYGITEIIDSISQRLD